MANRDEFSDLLFEENTKQIIVRKSESFKAHVLVLIDLIKNFQITQRRPKNIVAEPCIAKKSESFVADDVKMVGYTEQRDLVV